jgi:hypothetical protein
MTDRRQKMKAKKFKQLTAVQYLGRSISGLIAGGVLAVMPLTAFITRIQTLCVRLVCVVHFHLAFDVDGPCSHIG